MHKDVATYGVRKWYQHLSDGRYLRTPMRAAWVHTHTRTHRFLRSALQKSPNSNRAPERTGWWTRVLIWCEPRTYYFVLASTVPVGNLLSSRGMDRHYFYDGLTNFAGKEESVMISRTDWRGGTEKKQADWWRYWSLTRKDKKPTSTRIEGTST